jgi:hypothetical protein
MKQRIYNVPQNISDLVDVLGAMILGAPKFLDRTGYLPFRNLDYAFRELNEGLDVNRHKLGEERYQTLRRMSDEMRALFEADPDDTNGNTTKGCKIINEMLDIVLPPRSTEKPPV